MRERAWNIRRKLSAAGRRKGQSAPCRSKNGPVHPRLSRQKRHVHQGGAGSPGAACASTSSRPTAAAACPLKLDVKALAAARGRRGHCQEARALYEKITPFPHLLSPPAARPPAKASCKLRAAGGRHRHPGPGSAPPWPGARKAERRQPPAEKAPPSAAVFGSRPVQPVSWPGELARETLPRDAVTAAQDTPDGLSLAPACAPWPCQEAGPGGLPAGTFDTKLEIAFRWGCDPGGGTEREDQGESYALIRRRLGHWPGPSIPGLESGRGADGQPGRPAASPALYPGRAGRRLRGKAGRPQSADRLAQHLDPANTRGEEGSGGDPAVHLPGRSAAGSRRIPSCTDREDAQCERPGRCIQCRCDECLKGLRLSAAIIKKFPRILTREIYNNVSIIMGDHMMNKPINACALCGQCRVTLPQRLRHGRGLPHGPAEHGEHRQDAPGPPRVCPCMDMLFSNGEAFLCRPPAGL